MWLLGGKFFVFMGMFVMYVIKSSIVIEKGRKIFFFEFMYIICVFEFKFEWICMLCWGEGGRI